VRRAYCYALLAVLCWTTGPVGSKAALSASSGAVRLSPLQVAFWAILLGWMRACCSTADRRPLATAGGDLASRLAHRHGMGLFGWLAYPVAINTAYTHLPLAEAMIVSNLNPVFTILLQGAGFGWVLRRISGWEQTAGTSGPSPVARLVLGLTLCLAGVAVLATEGRAGALAELHLSAGTLAALLAAVAWAVYSNLGRFVAVRPGGDPRHLSDVQNFGAMTVGLVVMGLLLGLAGGLTPPSVSPSGSISPASVRLRSTSGSSSPSWLFSTTRLAIPSGCTRSSLDSARDRRSGSRRSATCSW